jgi:hypothetical protein
LPPPKKFGQRHHLEKWCWHYFLTQKALCFSTGYLKSKSECNLKKASFFDKVLMFASRQFRVTYCTTGNVSVSRHWWKTCRALTLQSRPSPLWFLGVPNA